MGSYCFVFRATRSWKPMISEVLEQKVRGIGF